MKTEEKHRLRIVFFGTSAFTTAVLDELKNAGFLPALIVTAPDRPKGRGHAITPPPAKIWGDANEIDVYQPEKLDAGTIAEVANSEWDLFLVASYGNIIPKALLELPRYGTLNVHPSLLPKYRGASPIVGQILADDALCGITIMLMDEKLDHGPILSQARIEIEEDDWPIAGSVLADMLAHEGGKLLAETIPRWVAGEITPEVQDESQATVTRKLKKEDGELEMESGLPCTEGASGRQNFIKIQAFDEWPGAFFFMQDGTRVKVTEASFADRILTIEKVVPEGKREMSWNIFQKI
jgi:methionyl-tRNA formyltransferase